MRRCDAKTQSSLRGRFASMKHPLFTTNLTILNKIKIILQTNKRNNLHNKSRNQNPASKSCPSSR